MHTVHLPTSSKNGVKYAAVGILFSTTDYWKEGVTDALVNTIDSFFDSLQWTQNKANPVVPLVPFGDLMMKMDTENRWIYKGSVTTPPCDTIVYWNVLQRVYPIKQKHLDLFEQQLARGGLDMIGNYRATQLIDKHNPFLI